MAPPSTPDQFPSSEMFDTLVRIEVGTEEDKESFDVYHGVLCFYSGFFKTALNGRWKESQDQTVRLPEDDPKLFQLLTYWIHTRCFFQSTLDPATLMSFTTLVKLWVLADVLDIPMLQNEVVGLIFKKMKAERRCMDQDAIKYVYSNTTEDSALRCLTHASIEQVLSCAFAGHELNSRRNLNDPHDLAWATDSLNLYAMRDRSGLEDVFKRLSSLERKCRWHVHSDGVKCSALPLW